MDMPATTELPKGLIGVKVQEIKHFNNELFSFKTDRPDGFRFRAGEFAMIGLMVDGKPLMRAYSIASPTWAESLEFYSIKVPDGPLTSRLQHITQGDQIILRPKPVGTLVLDALLPAERLFMFSTGTGVAPFASLIREPDVYDMFEKVFLIHTTRTTVELSYGFEIFDDATQNELFSELVGDKLVHLACTTREQSPNMGRISQWIEDGKLTKFANDRPLNAETDRVMICGSVSFLQTMKAKCKELGFEEGSNSSPGQYVIEKAFAE
jgi:ferredoxin--NADP+ reductase